MSAGSNVQGGVQANVKARDLVDSRQLLRLRQLREAKALREVGLAQDQHSVAWQQVQDRQEHIALVQRELGVLAAWVHGENLPGAAQLAPYAQASQDKLDDELERARYDLVNEQQTLQTAAAALSQARLLWQQAQARQQAVLQLSLDTERALRLQHEQRVESET